MYSFGSVEAVVSICGVIRAAEKSYVAAVFVVRSEIEFFAAVTVVTHFEPHGSVARSLFVIEFEGKVAVGIDIRADHTAVPVSSCIGKVEIYALFGSRFASREVSVIDVLRVLRPAVFAAVGNVLRNYGLSVFGKSVYLSFYFFFTRKVVDALCVAAAAAER